MTIVARHCDIVTRVVPVHAFILLGSYACSGYRSGCSAPSKTTSEELRQDDTQHLLHEESSKSLVFN